MLLTGASIASLTFNLIDWRDKYFDKAEDTTGDDGKKYNFYGFYGVTKVAADEYNNFEWWNIRFY